MKTHSIEPVANPQIKALKRELRRRKLPVERPQRQRSAAYYRGYDDAQMGAAPDYGQGTAGEFNDYRAGYRAGLNKETQ